MDSFDNIVSCESSKPSSSCCSSSTILLIILIILMFVFRKTVAEIGNSSNTKPTD